MQDQTDEEIIGALRACADETTRRSLHDQLFARYQTRIAAWCFRVTGDRESAADLAQDVLFRAYQKLDTYRGESKFSTWLYTLTRNHCFNEAKRRDVIKESPVDLSSLDAPVDDRFDLRLEREEDLRHMRSLIAETLDENERRVMTLHYGEEMPLESVTRLLGLSNQSGAKAYVVSARRKLKGAVERWQARQAGRNRS